MKSVVVAALALAVATVSAPAIADRGKDESGQGHKHGHRGHKGGEYKEEFWDGDCKVERKWERDGDYKEEVKCKDGRPRARHHTHDHPDSVGVIVAPPAVVIQPPAVVIEGPSIRIK